MFFDEQWNVDVLFGEGVGEGRRWDGSRCEIDLRRMDEVSFWMGQNSQSAMSGKIVTTYRWCQKSFLLSDSPVARGGPEKCRFSEKTRSRSEWNQVDRQ